MHVHSTLVCVSDWHHSRATQLGLQRNTIARTHSCYPGCIQWRYSTPQRSPLCNSKPVAKHLSPVQVLFLRTLKDLSKKQMLEGFQNDVRSPRALARGSICTISSAPPISCAVQVPGGSSLHTARMHQNPTHASVMTAEQLSGCERSIGCQTQLALMRPAIHLLQVTGEPQFPIECGFNSEIHFGFCQITS